MSEIRRDTRPMSREEIARALEEQRNTLPFPVLARVAEANGQVLEECRACRGTGAVEPSMNALVVEALGVDEDEAPITAVDDIVTQPVGK